jgi:Uma2 family endonuclease
MGPSIGMSSLTHSRVNWPEFLRLPERPPNAQRYELHDGEVVVVPPARPLHKKIQKRIERLLETLAETRGVVSTEFPYRPMGDLQYWVADVAYVPQADWDAIPADDYPIYAPPLIVEVLSPSNRTAKIDRQRTIAMSAGTREFWVVDAERRSVQVTNPGGDRTYSAGTSIAIEMFGGALLSVADVFE